jgi:ubiquinone biosynthesis protein
MLKASSIPTPLVAHHEAVTIVATAGPARFPFLTIAARLLWWSVSVLWLRVTSRGGPAEYGRRFRLLLEDLGGLWIKLGQLLSLRVDLFPLEFCRELSHLQIKVVGFSPSEAIEILEADLGRPVDSLFREFDLKPFAAASMGQVHLARLHQSGTRVAVKVQRPNLPLTFEHQLRIIRWIVWMVQRVGYRPNLRWEELIWELNQIMQEEMDCRYEGSTTRRMRRTLKGHNIVAPKVFYATRRVLVTEFIDGVLMADYIHVLNTTPERMQAWVAENRVDPALVGRKLIMSLLRQILEDNLFHGDLHPGNVMLLRDSQVALIDFGACSFTERQYLEYFRQTILALAARDYAKAADLTLLLCGPLPRVDLDAIRDEFIQVMHAWAAKTAVAEVPYHEKSVAVIYNEVIRILYEHHGTMEWALLRIRRAQETLDASLLYLLPDANYSKIAARYFRASDRRAGAATARAEATRTAPLSALGSALEMAERLEEFTLFRAAVIRRHVQRFQVATNRAIDLVAAGIGRFALIGCLVTLFAFTAFLAQRHPGGVASVLGEEVAGWLRVVPVLDGHVWSIVLVAGAWGCLSLIRLRHRMRRHDQRPEEQASLV